MNQWNPKLYEKKHAFVYQYGEDLFKFLAPGPNELILDLGCGTGQLTSQLANMGARVVGIDASPAMIAQAKQYYPHLEWHIADGANFSFDRRFDAVFSNAALHWIKPPEAAVKCISECLKPGGRLVAEFGGKGNVQKIVNAMVATLSEFGYPVADLPWYFPSIAEYASILDRYGMEVTFASLSDRPTQLQGEEGIRDWLRMFAGSILENIPAQLHPEIFTSIEAKLKSQLYQNHCWSADYRRLKIVAVKAIVQ